jgi:hypothetical protein
MPNPLQQLLNHSRQRQTQGIMGGIEPVKMATGGLVPSGGLPYGSPQGALGGYGGMGLGTGMGYAEGGEAADIDLEDIEPETQNRAIKYIKENPGKFAGLALLDAMALALLVMPVPGARVAAGITKGASMLGRLARGVASPIKSTKAAAQATKAGVEKRVGSRAARKAAERAGITSPKPTTALTAPGYYEALGREAIGKSNIPARIGAGTVLAAGTLPFIGGEEETLTVSEAEVPQSLGTPVPETSTFWEKAKEFPQDFWKKMQTDENFRRQAMAGFVNMGKFTEGYVPRSGLTDFTEGMLTEAGRQEGEMSEAQKTIAMIQQMNPNMSAAEVMNLVLGTSTGDMFKDSMRSDKLPYNDKLQMLAQLKDDIYKNKNPDFDESTWYVVTRRDDGTLKRVGNTELMEIVREGGTQALKDRNFDVIKRKDFD